jgi:hypothetical protein
MSCEDMDDVDIVGEDFEGVLLRLNRGEIDEKL